MAPSKPVAINDFPLADNVTVTIADGVATFAVTLTDNVGPTASFKNTMIAKTPGGAIDLPGNPGVKVQLTMYRNPTEAEAAEYAPSLAALKAAAK